MKHTPQTRRARFTLVQLGSVAQSGDHPPGQRPRSLGVPPGSHAVGLREAARRIGLSYNYAKRLATEGRFRVPHLPRLGPRGHFRFSPHEIDDYLRNAERFPHAGDDATGGAR